MDEISLLKQKLQEKERELALLYKIIRKMTHSMDWQEIQETTLDIIMETFEKVTFCLIGIFLENENTCILRTRKREENFSRTDKITFAFKFTEGIGWDSVIATNEWNDFFVKLGRSSEYQASFFPLTTEERDIGILMVDKHKSDASNYTEYSLLSTITSHAAVSLNNSYLYKLAITDSLTGLYTRRYFMQRLEREFSRSHRLNYHFSLFMMDIDFFKKINDTYGHLVGDMILKQLSEIFLESLKEYGITARYGGEEFISIITEKDKSEALEIAEKIREKVENFNFKINQDDKTLKITISIGVVTYPTDGNSLNSLIDNADKALYEAKNKGRNKVIPFIK